MPSAIVSRSGTWRGAAPPWMKIPCGATLPETVVPPWTRGDLRGVLGHPPSFTHPGATRHPLYVRLSDIIDVESMEERTSHPWSR
jgi:hypothetical protein